MCILDRPRSYFGSAVLKFFKFLSFYCFTTLLPFIIAFLILWFPSFWHPRGLPQVCGRTICKRAKFYKKSWGISSFPLVISFSFLSPKFENSDLNSWFKVQWIEHVLLKKFWDEAWKKNTTLENKSFFKQLPGILKERTRKSKYENISKTSFWRI